MKILILLLFCFTLYSCGQNENKTTGSNSTTNQGNNPDQNNTTPNATNTEREKTENQNKSSSPESNENGESTPDWIRVKFPTGSTQLTINGNTAGFGKNIKYVFEASKGQTLTASVKPKSGTGNIRINQIITPSGKADGPFSTSMTYGLNENGDWKLVLGENQMAGDPWKGEYLLTIEIK